MTACRHILHAAILFMLFAAFPTPLRALPVPGPVASARPEQPLLMETEDEVLVRWDLKAESINTLNDEEILEARGNVFLKRGNEYLKADFARYYMSTKWVFLKGNVVVRSGKDELAADEAEFDLRSRTGWLRNGRIFMSGPHVYVAGERIEKHWGDVYTFKQAKVTTCDDEVPAWSFTADEAVVEIDGYARLTGSSFQVKDTPVAYAPYFLMPVKTSRQTGFLMPEYGVSSTKGSYFNVPFFWAVNESNDITLNEQFMDKRGFLHGLEYRTRPTSSTSGWFRADFLRDRLIKSDPGQGEFAGDGLVRNNENRYWLRGMFDTRFDNSGRRLKVDIDYVSDQYFISEFKNTYGGLERTRDAVFDFFSREFQEHDQDRLSGILLTQDWERGSVALSSFYRQVPMLGNGNRSASLDETVQQLPQFDAFLHKGRILPDLPLEIEASAQAAYMYRRSGTRGARYEVIPRLTLPLNNRYGSLIMSAGLYQTFYDTELPGRTAGDKPDGPRQDKASRTVPEFSAAAFTELARVFYLDPAPLEAVKEKTGDSQWTALRHSVQPRLEFRQRTRENQSRNPRYSNEDRLLPETELVYSISNVITAKSEKVVMEKGEDGEMRPVVRTEYKDMLRLRLEQGYDFREADRSEERERYARRPFGDILAEVELNIFDNVYFNSRNYFSPYEGELVRHQSGLNFEFPEYGKAFVGYDSRRAIDEYKRSEDRNLNYLRFGLETTAVGPFSFAAEHYQDFKDMDNSETNLDVIFNHQCFQLIGRVRTDPREENYMLMIRLTGLGD
ncbi:MAG: LPS assembly protein LptD [Desulfovibrio sp.]|jgi:LPS-assembly protein|nr:LPS assembly protein LptD [Desulfovibrio sp.]